MLSVHYVPIDAITVLPNRHRKNFGVEELNQLAGSILQIGLIHPPIVRFEEDRTVLCCGERRLRAMQSLWLKKTPFNCLGEAVIENCAPVLFYHELDPVTAQKVELEENLRRVDLTWQENAQAVAALHKLTLATVPNSTATDTAKILDEQFNYSINGSRVKTMTLLTEYMNRPEVSAARTEQDAIKAMYKVIEREIDMKIGSFTKPTVSYFCGDAVEVMAGLPESHYDVICTDPPYGIDADKSGLHEFGAQVHSYADSWTVTENLLRRCAPLFDHVTKDKAHLYLFCDFLYFPLLKQIFTDLTPFTVWPRPLIWVKDAGTLPVPDFGPKRLYECVLYANKGKRMVTGVYGDVLTYPHDPSRIHAAQKPVALIKDLLRRSCRASDKVLDPFCGSGTIFIAAKELNMHATGIDSDPATARIVAERTK